ncbi:helix-turn-helix transcriptional regulator [Gordonia sihwensis]|uniref:helix-turn-helix transcriptional regulator n=1 Tax=Gordonia sihwensis TaxID=173559 RepID=UPI003D953B47
MASQGNSRLRAARRSLGMRSQRALAEAINDKAVELGLRGSKVTERTVRRWESATPGWPHPDTVNLLEIIFQTRITNLGFTSPWNDDVDTAGSEDQSPPPTPVNHRRPRPVGTPPPPSAALLPASTGYDYIATTAVYRRHYWTLPAASLYRVLVEHVHLGFELINQFTEPDRARVCTAVAESSMLAGRLAFFDLRTPDSARDHFARALEAAYEAGDDTIGAAVLAHLAFAPAFSGDPTRAEEARDHIRAAFAFARRGEASTAVTAWLHAVSAEVETRLGEPRKALALIRDAERILSDTTAETRDPAWFDWFSQSRLEGFKGNTLIAAGNGREAQVVLTAALDELPSSATKQRAVILADLAAADVLRKEPEQACKRLMEALDLLGLAWYATAMDRIKSVRQSLREWDSLPAVRTLDAKLYNWNATVNSIAH